MIKQSILVPRWLGMSPGKVASQCCHAVASTAGTMDEKRVILGVNDPITMKILAKLATTLGLHWNSFTDYGPTTEGTDGVTTVYWVRGDEMLVNQVTEDLELY